MDLATSEQAREADRIAIEERKIPSATLMENAGRGVFEALLRWIPDIANKSVAIVCGKGNNGGDGRIAARLLRGVAREVSVVDVGAIHPKGASSRGELPLQSVDIIIDAIFGIGLSRPVEGPQKAAIEAINDLGKKILAIDIPSGLSADTGKPLGVAVRADLTVTMGVPKIGLVLPEAFPYVGRLEVADIGVPQDVYEDLHFKNHWVTAEDVRPFFKPRMADTHKGTYGHALFVGGSAAKPGAILMSGRAALRTGAGLVTVALPEKAFRKFPKGFLELMFAPHSGSLDKVLKCVEGKSSIGVGPGMGVTAPTKALVRGLIRRTKIPMVLDADGLNNVTPKDLRKGMILTPHPGEMARLIGKTTSFVQKNRVAVARDFAVKHGVFLVLKGFRTLTATPGGHVYINATGNPGMATAGMGDVLTGIIASLLAQGHAPLEAAVGGVWLHGRAGDRVAERLGDRGLLAGDVTGEIPLVFKELLS